MILGKKLTKKCVVFRYFNGLTVFGQPIDDTYAHEWTTYHLRSDDSLVEVYLRDVPDKFLMELGLQLSSLLVVLDFRQISLWMDRRIKALRVKLET